MKHLFLLCAIVVVLSSFGCSDHSLSPVNECNIPQDLTTAQSGSSWIYKRTLLDASGNPTTGNASTYDTLTLLGRDPSQIKDGEIALKLEDRYSNDGGLTFRRDTIYWVINASMFYVNNIKFQNVSCDCFYQKDIKWRLYEDCGEPEFTIMDSTFTGDTFPSKLADGKTVYTDIINTIKNTYKTFGSERMTVGSESVDTKKSQSYLSRYLKTHSQGNEADSVNFTASGKSTLELRDDRTVWTNKSIGIVRERGITLDESASSTFQTPHSFERTLVKYTVLK